ncbi:hypothetical protein [Nocardioides sp. URHA0032]|uniref:hypothetical protein n=1 Tax=Nocardioides sp. URHA0032 TaxID=1380388 RepID=UPI00048ABE08|nr:hypothetical protein [Nocardioides sp. URHA0032]
MTAFVVLCGVLFVAALAVIWTCDAIDESRYQANIPSPDASDAEFEAWARQAMRIGNSAGFEASVRADIEALTNGDVA